SRIEPPGRASFSTTSGSAPRRRASAAAASPAIPAPATMRSGMASVPESRWQRRSDEREAGLVLDVLDPHALRAAQEDRERVRRVLDVVDLEAGALRLALHAVRVVHEQREVVEQRAAAVRRAAA